MKEGIEKMEERKSARKNTVEENKRLIMLGTFWKMVSCVGLLVLIWGGYIFAKQYWTDRILNIREDDFSWVCQVDSVEIKEGKLLLKGFAFQLGANAVKNNCEIVLQELETGKRYFLKMSYLERKDVNDYFLCEYDYLQSGFVAEIKEKRLDLDKKNYEVLLRIAGEQTAYQTDTYLSGGKLMYANPAEFVPLEVAGTALEEIVENGVLRVYRPDYGMYVYQYDGELYWIAEPEYGFVEEDTYVQYQLSTTQVEKIPQHRIENGWNWDNIGFLFSANELTELDIGKYRVAKKRLPSEYSIVKIWTGNYIDGWIWLHNFRPYYQF